MTPARLALFALLATLAAAGEPAKVEIAGTHADETFRREARGALRLAWPVFCELAGVDPAQDKPYVVNVYRDREEYLKADRDLNGGRFANNGGFFSIGDGKAHLLLAPRTEEAYTRRVPLTERMRGLLVHEASHMFWRRHVAWYEGAPQWALEGVAELCAEREAAGRSSDHLYFSAGLRTLRRAAETGRLIPLEDLLVADLASQPDAFQRDLFYRESWALVRWLASTQPETWKALTADFSTVGDHRDSAVRGRTFFRKRVGDPRAVQAAWLEWIRSLPCGPWETKFGDWRLDGQELEGTAYPGTGSAIFHSQELTGDATVSSEVWVQDLASGQADILLGGWDDRARNFVKVAFVKTGIVALLVLKEEVWTRVAMAQAPTPPVSPETWTRIAVEIRGRRVLASAGDTVVLEHELDDDDVRLDGRWGFGNFDSSVRFRNWKVETP